MSSTIGLINFNVVITWLLNENNWRLWWKRKGMRVISEWKDLNGWYWGEWRVNNIECDFYWKSSLRGCHHHHMIFLRDLAVKIPSGLSVKLISKQLCIHPSSTCSGNRCTVKSWLKHSIAWVILNKAAASLEFIDAGKFWTINFRVKNA